MVKIDIEVPRPLLTFGIIAAVGYFAWSGSLPLIEVIGGSGTTQAEVVHDAEEEIRQARLEQQVLSRREGILRGELDALEKEEQFTHDPDVRRELVETRASLIALIKDQKAAEQEILESLHQIWEAQGYAQMASRTSNGSLATIDLAWPVDPELGISAHFDDAGYEARFGMPHQAIDIPVLQGSVVAAAADGTVVKVSDNGMGFNSLVIRHDGGFATLYGHVSEFLVEEGQEVVAGDPIALSGGRPGTKGAGRMTTGSHLHLQVLKDGAPVDPLQYLPD